MKNYFLLVYLSEGVESIVDPKLVLMPYFDAIKNPRTLYLLYVQYSVNETVR